MHTFWTPKTLKLTQTAASLPSNHLTSTFWSIPVCARWCISKKLYRALKKSAKIKLKPRFKIRRRKCLPSARVWIITSSIGRCICATSRLWHKLQESHLSATDSFSRSFWLKNFTMTQRTWSVARKKGMFQAVKSTIDDAPTKLNVSWNVLTLTVLNSTEAKAVWTCTLKSSTMVATKPTGRKSRNQ